MDKWAVYVRMVFVIFVCLCQYSHGASEPYDDDDDDPSSWMRCPWIRNKLPNGKVKIRSRGRIAKFQCDLGFELAGKRFATCVRGQWNNPIPVCVARGCPRRPYVPNSRVSEMYRGAVLIYDCNPGYTIVGGATIYCDGRYWSSNAPSCEVAIENPETSCDFEGADLCGWSNDPTHDFDWRRNQFATPSGHVGTGPSYDHTFGEGRGGFYLYMEASAPRKAEDMARLFSPVYSKDLSGGCFVFWYHMYGYSTGGLKIYVKPESHEFGEVSPVWYLFGDQGNQWLRGYVEVQQTNENFQIIIEGIRGRGYLGDTAIDDVSVRNHGCETIDNSTEPYVDFNVSSSCRGRCAQIEEGVCQCTVDCWSEGNCCSDYAATCTRTDSEDTDVLEQTVTQLSLSTAFTEQKERVSFEVPTSSLNTTPLPSSSSAIPSSSSFPVTETVPSNAEVSSDNGTTAHTVASTISETTSTTIQITTPSTTTQTTTPSTTPSTTTTTAPPTTTASRTSTTLRTSTIRMIPPTSTSSTTPTTTTSMTTTLLAIPSSSSTTTTFRPITHATESTSVSTTSTTENIFIATLPYILTTPSTTLPPSPATSSSSIITTISEITTSTRKTYNLRPRNRTSSTSGVLTKTTPVYIPVTLWESSTQLLLPTTMPPQPTSKTPTPIPSTTTTRKPFYYPTPKGSATTSTPRRFKFPTYPTIYNNLPDLAKETVPTPSTRPASTTQKDFIHKDAHSSKAASKTSDNMQPTVTIVSVTVVLLIFSVAVIIYFLRRWKIRKQSKLADDSEMRFLSENEVIEFSDSSALDRHNLHQPF